MEHLNTTKCECGHTFTAKEIKPPLIKVNDHRLFGGNVKRQSEAECACGTKYLLWLKPEHNTYTVKTISLVSKPDEQIESTDDSITDEPVKRQRRPRSAN